MWTLDVLLIALSALAVPVSVSAAASPAPLSETELSNLYQRGIIDESSLQTSYDFVIAGGGLAGLVLASRLSENSKTSVLVLEAGKSGDEVKDRINAPAGAYYSSIVGTDYDWKHKTVPQPKLNNRVIDWPRGKILGGSTAMNAMYLVRPSQTEMDAWQSVISSDADASSSSKSSSSNWGWDKMYTYMKRAENFTKPDDEVLKVVDIKYDASTHGSGGPMQLSYPAVMIDIVTNWTQSCALAGIPEQEHPNGGITLGGFITPSSINPSNLTRSYSRSAYIDSLPPRSNLHILAQQTVTKLVFSDKPDSSGLYEATGVQFGSSASSVKSVKVNKEVLLSGGALGSPKVLLHSGVGPKDVLDAAGVPVKVELPGVGQRLQDHLTAPVTWATTHETAGNIHDSGTDFSKSSQFLSFINDAVAFANISALFPAPGSAAAFQKEILAALDNSTLLPTLIPSSYDTVKAGYKAMYEVAATKFFGSDGNGGVEGARGVAQLEMLMSVISPGSVSVQAAMQHPYSIGRLWINTTDPFQEVLIDPGYYTHPADLVIMRQGLKLVRQVGLAYGDVLGAETAPGPAIQSDQDIDNWLITQGANTQYHPTGSCAMLPKSLGGVVDKDLKVYGLENVRVVDASVFPFEFAAHLASTTYGVAEQAADLLKAKSYVVSASESTAHTHTVSFSLFGLFVASVMYLL